MKIKWIFLLASFFFLAGCSGSSITEPHTLGNPDTPILIEEFSDIQCPACGLITPQVEAIVRNNRDLARLEYRHFPLNSIHPFAFRAAEASECAADQGKFWEYLDTAFANQSNLSDDRLFSFAKQIGLDEEAFRTCFMEGHKKAQVRSDLAEGTRRSVNATPTFFINGQRVRFENAEKFEALIRSLTN